MPHPSHSPALRAVTAPASGTVSTDQFGLTIVPLGGPGAAKRPPPPPLLSELDPPDPGSLLAANPTSRLVGLGLGDTLPLSARWWRLDSPQLGAPLPPALAALLILAREAGTGLRSSARTALWEGYRRTVTAEPLGGPSRWALLRGQTVLAMHLVRWGSARPSAASPRPGTLATSPVHPHPGGDAATSVVRLTHAEGHRMEVWLVRASRELPDAVLPGTRADEGPADMRSRRWDPTADRSAHRDILLSPAASSLVSARPRAGAHPRPPWSEEMR